MFYLVSVNEYFILEGRRLHQPLGARKVKDRRNTARLLAHAIYVLPCALSQTVLFREIVFDNLNDLKTDIWEMQSDSFMCSFIWQPLIECQLYPPKSKGLCITEKVQVRGDCSQTLMHLEFLFWRWIMGPHSILCGRLLGWEQQPSQCRQTVRCAGLGLRGRMNSWERSLEKLGRGQAVNTVWFRQCPPCVWHIALQMLFYLISITDRYYSNPTLAHQGSTFNSSQGQEAWKTEAIAAGSHAGHEKTSQRKM